jgi:uncharacterized protein (TIGR02680 family)
LPEAKRTRWQPIRGGLLNIYRYDHVEFRYEDGRLLLRGNNGTGKSRVLALQLPFLLDGEIIPQRVEPDGDIAKRMEWNLLLGKYDDRLGYTWIEFGRRNADGTTEYKTLGCGLRAVETRGIAARWFFITTQRMGRDLFLQADANQPLSRQKLEKEVGSCGMVYDKPEEYRRGVDAALFKLGDRYDALLNLLIQLRQPQLSRKLDEQKLSRALSQALPPLSERVLGDVAEAFRSLEADRDDLNNFVAARDAADLFLKDYRRYTQIAARRRAKEVREKHSAYVSATGRLRSAETALGKAKADFNAIEAVLKDLALDQQRAAAAQAALRESPQMKDARDLANAGHESESLLAEANSVSAEHDQAVAALKTEQTQFGAETAKLLAARSNVEVRLNPTDVLAAAAGLEAKHRETFERLHFPDIEGEYLGQAEDFLGGQRRDRLKAARHLENLNASVTRAELDRTLAKQSLQHAEDQFTEATEAQRKAHDIVERESLAVTAAYAAWTETLSELRPISAVDFEQAFENWLDSPQSESLVTSVLRRAEAEAGHRLATERADRIVLRDLAQQRLDKVQLELARVRTGYHEPPPAPHTRAPESRAERAGAPLWALCDFVSSAADTSHADIEAALESAGLLDAWVIPDGLLVDDRVHDTVILPAASPAGAPSRSIQEVLTPAVDRDDPQARLVSDEVVAAILSTIGFGRDSGEVWIDVDGSWQVGPLRGAWSKPEAQHIGHGTREANRRRRIVELENEVLVAAEGVAQLTGFIAALDARKATMTQEIASAPTDAALRDALAAATAARGVVENSRARVQEAELRVTAYSEELKKATDVRDRDAAELRLSDSVDRLKELIDAVHAYGDALGTLFGAARTYSDRRTYAANAKVRLTEAAGALETRARKLQQARGRSEAARVRFETLQASVGAGVKDLQERLSAADVALSRIQALQDQEKGKKDAAKVREAVETNTIASATAAVADAESRRSLAISGLMALVMTRVLRDAHADFSVVEAGEWPVTRSVDLARKIEATFGDVESDDAPWSRNQRDIMGHFETLQTELRSHDYMPEATIIDEIFVVTVPFQSRLCTMTELRDAVLDEIRERQTMLDARERDVLEKHLIKDVAENLHDLLHDALQWVDQMNREIQSRPMSTGMTLRFKWEPQTDGPQAFAAARDLLLRARGTWAPDERLAVGQFLHQQIKAVRAENDTGTWQEHLAFALDYRQWHQFAVERKQEGTWKRLTKRTHGTGSGGEKAIALTLPQFAAAAAHYGTADPLAPRLILLDEAFVGVDSDMRSKCMDLLTAFDLDFVMTSEREWACYPTVPAVAIYQLSARADVDAVGVTRWVWNGKQRIRDDSPMSAPAHDSAPVALEL